MNATLRRLWLSVILLMSMLQTIAGAQAVYVPSQPGDIQRLTQSLAQGLYQPVTDRNEISQNGSYISNGTDLNATSLIKKTCARDCGSIVLRFDNWSSQYSALDVVNANSITVKASIVDKAGTRTPVFFNGSRTKLIDAGGYVYSDPLSVDIAAASTVSIYTCVTVTSGQVWHANYVTVSTNGEGVSASADNVDSGTVTASASYGYGPTVVYGIPTTGRRLSVFVAGDSIAAGTGASAGNDNGYICQALSASSIPWVRVALPSDRGQYFAITAKSWLRQSLAAGCTTAICEYGSNDYSSTQANRSLANMKTDFLAIWAELARMGMTVYQTTVTPQNTSATVLWTTTGGQTANANDAVRTGFNDWLRDTTSTGAVYLSGGNLTGVIEVADTVESARNSGLWLTYAASVTSTITSGTTTVLTKTGAGWTTNQWASVYVLTYTSGVNSGQSRLITSNTATTITTPAFSGGTPSASDAFTITQVVTTDGVHPDPVGVNLAAAAIVPANLRYTTRPEIPAVVDLIANTVFHTRPARRRTY